MSPVRRGAVAILMGYMARELRAPRWGIPALTDRGEANLSYSPRPEPIKVACAVFIPGKEKPPRYTEKKLPGDWRSGHLFIRSEGWLLSDYGKHVLLPEEKFKDYKRPAPTIPKSIGHHAEWIKDRSPTTCNFDYSGTLAETVLLAAKT